MSKIKLYDKAFVERAIVKLQEARSLVAQGWCKHNMMVSDKRKPAGYRFCIIGAVDDVSLSNDLHSKKRFILKRFMTKVLSYKIGTVLASFNDHPKTKKKDVIKAFDDSIEYLQSKIKEAEKGC